MQFHTSLSNAQDLIHQLAKKFDLTVNTDCQRSSIQLPSRVGELELISYRISEGLEAFIVSGTLKSDWIISFEIGPKAIPITFYTLASGIFQCVQEGPQTEDFLLEPLQSAISATPTGNTLNKWIFGRQQEISFLAILLHKEAFFAEVDCSTLHIPEDLLAITKDIASQKSFLYTAIYYLPIVTALQEILQQEDIGLLNSTFAAAKLYEILFYQLQQYQENGNSLTNGQLKPDQDLDLIRNAENILVTRLQSPPTIPELAKMAGINQQTLKKGFKQLYGLTINQYLNNKRLDQAEILIKNGGLKLRDVALEVGYNNPSYFSRRFKEKYGVTPRHYTRQTREGARVNIIE